ncbi:MAG: family 16 glycosylhydrolase, partial [Bacteroidota bacterium]
RKMKNVLKILSLSFLAMFSCQEEDAEFGEVIAPSNVVVTTEVVGQDANNPFGDGSGFVTIKASAENASGFTFNFGDGTEGVFPSGEVTHRFTQVGVNTYTVVVNALGTGGLSTTISTEIEVFSSFDDLEAKELLSGGIGNSKTWYLAASEIGHLGVGGTIDIAPDAFWFPSFFATQPFEKCGAEISDCLCDDEFTFSMDENEQLTMVLNNNGQTFFNVGHTDIAGGSDAGEDVCLDFDTSGTSIVSLSPTDFDWSIVPDPDFNGRGTTMTLSDGKFMGYYVSSSTYEIISVTNSSLYVRTIDGNNPVLYWYHKFTTTQPSDDFISNYDELIWADEFETDGAPNPSNWTYDLGTGNNGWGNGESQFYTDEADNVIVENGILKITAKAESFSGSDYTSSRIKTQGLFDFTYGRIEFSAKLPTGGGTWPALWMLGSNITEVSWPECGEIDVMEHIGNNQNQIYGTLHFPENFGGNAIGGETTNPTASTDFHLYSVEWRPDQIIFLLDNEVYFTFNNDGSLPFNNDFFIIINQAMGGNFGGDIDPNFTESTLEVDYVRVYQ